MKKTIILISSLVLTLSISFSQEKEIAILTYKTYFSKIDKSMANLPWCIGNVDKKTQNNFKNKYFDFEIKDTSWFIDDKTGYEGVKQQVCYVALVLKMI